MGVVYQKHRWQNHQLCLLRRLQILTQFSSRSNARILRGCDSIHFCDAVNGDNRRVSRAPICSRSTHKHVCSLGIPHRCVVHLIHIFSGYENKENRMVLMLCLDILLVFLMLLCFHRACKSAGSPYYSNRCDRHKHDQENNQQNHYHISISINITFSHNSIHISYHWLPINISISSPITKFESLDI